MPNAQRLIRRFARQYGIDPLAALAVARTEGGLRNRAGDIGDLSGGGSYGPFQLYAQGALPSQYRGNPQAADQWAWSPQGIAYAIRKMAEAGAKGLSGQEAIEAIVRKFERPADPSSQIAKALALYGGVPGGMTGGASPGAMPGAAPGASSGGSSALEMIQALGGGEQNPVWNMIGQALARRETQAPAPAQAAAQGQPLQAGGDWGGSQGMADSLVAGIGLAKTGKRDRMMTSTGNVSDHYSGNKNAFAYDLSGSVQQMDNAAAIIARRLGVSYRKGQPLSVTVNRNGYRIQVLYRTNTGGDHFDHIHVGVKRT